MICKHCLTAGQFQIHHRRHSPDLEPHRKRSRLRIGSGVRAGGLHPHDEFPFISAGSEPGVGDSNGHVADRRIRKGEQLKADLLRQLREGVSQPAPASRLQGPVIGPLVGTNPDLGGPRRVLPDVVVGGAEHARDVCWRRGGLGCRKVREPLRRDLNRHVGCAEKQAPGRRKGGKRLGQLAAAGREFAAHHRWITGLHARTAIEDHHGRVGATAAGQCQPAPRERSPDSQDHPRHRQHPQQHDQPVAEPRIATREGLGCQQKHHPAPLHRLEPPLVDQVDDQGQAHERQRCEDPGLEKRHRRLLQAARPTRNRASNCS